MNANYIINFDSCDWDSIIDTYKKVGAIGEPQLGKTSEGEDITFETAGNCLVTRVYQKNHWIREVWYDISDYTVEETYEREAI